MPNLIIPERVRVGTEVAEAIDQGRAVVALESAVLTHGLPHPLNLDGARRMEAAVRGAGAVPATCVIDEGLLVIGASPDFAERAALHPLREKASVRDLAPALIRRVPAGLTVSATLFAAQLAGIRVFATGGIGGVHVPGTRGDVSADLLQLSRTPAVTVCSGAKSVLDIPRTLEYLETLGVPVFGFQTDTFPAFYLRSSGEPVPSVASPEAVAEMARTQWKLGHHACVVVGNPIREEEQISEAEWIEWLKEAQARSERDGVRGKAVTPYLLDQAARLSNGRTVTANLVLLEDNARLAGQIAIALAR